MYTFLMTRLIQADVNDTADASFTRPGAIVSAGVGKCARSIGGRLRIWSDWKNMVLVLFLCADPPFFIIRPSAVYQATPGQTITMPCVAHGDPPPRMVWNKVRTHATTHPNCSLSDWEEKNKRSERKEIGLLAK